MTVPADYFDAMYAADADPWGFDSRWYERRKYAVTLAALPARHYRRVFEPGCSIGVLSAGLAGRCDELLCWDVADAPVSAARARLADHRHALVERGDVSDRWPDGSFDLIVVGELAYYLDDAGRDRLWTAVTGSLDPGGALVAVHWRPPVDDYPVTGDDVHAELAARPGLERTVSHVEADFRLEVYLRTPPAARSVARLEGLW